MRTKTQRFALKTLDGNRKRQLMLSAFVVLCLLVRGQYQVPLSVCAGAGNANSAWNNNNVQWTLGETFIGHGQSGSNGVTNGFNQASTLTVGIRELKQLETAGVNVYPNPVSQNLIIEVEQGSSIKSAELFDAFGKAMARFFLQTGSNTYSCDNLSTGLYFIRFTNTENTITKSITLQKSNN